MRFITYLENNQEKVGVINDKDQVFNMNVLLEGNKFNTMQELIENFDQEKLMTIKKGMLEKNTQSISLDNIQLKAPIPIPLRSIICLGLNYKDHVVELKDSLGKERKIPDVPVYFSKMANRIVGPGGLINPHHNITQQVDYEVELAIIIGKEGTNIKKEEVEAYIFGYSIMNDITARDLQRKHTQWTRGKSLDTFTTMGPCIVHKDVLPLPLELELSSKVNGELRQKSNTKNLIFDIPYIISDLSKGITLMPGDIIATGTPSGVGMGFEPPKLLKSGDMIECHIDKIGTLINKVE
ncbi:fumarylacetoacetate hydrolase family protein [Serpentinicella sp. ANB-PHB4]|uniref:fumarylacetoacetate hydrolase family protein n=1 Tax=Serpentinicella sp. ANB-PHB4 TaxID=3074076 RepID=UPI00285F7065|nr:fumarylacetoacetate hydrolase family protein [Serpentinicella sp. ANB-PHB4]MDR5659414.1 fumarylacetoacetate hydrolase family protein [Serpentinicella sp. ANB-PHB4]